MGPEGREGIACHESAPAFITGHTNLYVKFYYVIKILISPGSLGEGRDVVKRPLPAVITGNTYELHS